MNKLLITVDRMITKYEPLASLIGALAERVVPHATASAGCPRSWNYCGSPCRGRLSYYFCTEDPCAGVARRCTFKGCLC